MNLQKRHFNLVRTLVHKNALRVTAGKSWREISTQLNVGVERRGQIHFTREDLRRLRQWCERNAGLDPLSGAVTGGRMTAVTQVRDEKWATSGVFEDLVRVARLEREVTVGGESFRVPAGALLQVAWSAIDIEDIEAVVVVENGAAALHWHACHLPPELRSALMVYRGHGESEIRAVREWLQSLPDNILVAGFMDFDPAGIGIALDLAVGAVVVPAVLDDTLLAGINNKPQVYRKQMLSRPSLGGQVPEPLHEIWNWMTAPGRECALTQERIIQQGVPLLVRMLN